MKDNDDLRDFLIKPASTNRTVATNRQKHRKAQAQGGLRASAGGTSAAMDTAGVMEITRPIIVGKRITNSVMRRNRNEDRPNFVQVSLKINTQRSGGGLGDSNTDFNRSAH